MKVDRCGFSKTMTCNRHQQLFCTDDSWNGCLLAYQLKLLLIQVFQRYKTNYGFVSWQFMVIYQNFSLKETCYFLLTVNISVNSQLLKQSEMDRLCNVTFIREYLGFEIYQVTSFPQKDSFFHNLPKCFTFTGWNFKLWLTFYHCIMFGWSSDFRDTDII